MDFITGNRIEDVTVELLRADSTVLRRLPYTNLGQMNGKERSSTRFYLYETGKYLLRLSKDGYETTYYPLTCYMGRRSPSWVFPPAAKMRRIMQPKTYKLGEAVVKATKIKMVMHGDTVVYNADAFQLAEGSMLDALVERLPGVELRDNGVITLNGRRVSELLVNGKNFFRGDPTVALDNLPAYMVDKVKVYERTTAYQQHFEPYSVNRPLVMDVNLKKEYSVGWIANAEAAYGSDHRYLGRVFALGFTPKTRTALFGNFNNTNDTRRPGRRGDWTPSDALNGLQTAQNVGAEFSYEDPDAIQNTWTTSVNWKRTLLDRYNLANRERFLPEGSTYGTSDEQRNHRAVSIDVNNNYDYVSDQLAVSGALNFHYDNNRLATINRSSTFTTNPFSRPGRELLDSLFAPDGGSSLLRAITLNRTRSLSLALNKGWNINLPAFNVSFKPFSSRGISDAVAFGLTGYYGRNDYRTFSQSRLDYPYNTDMAPDFRNHYYDNTPHNYSFSPSVSYSARLLHGWSVTPSYRYSHSYAYGRNDHYRLDWADGWGAADSAALGTLPSASTLEQVAHDLANSEYSRRWQQQHTVNLTAYMSRNTDKGHYFEFSINTPLDFRHERIDYSRGTLLADRSRWSVVFSPYFYVMQRYRLKKKNRSLQIETRCHHYDTPADMLQLLNYHDDSNPLNTYTGNPNLKRTYSENLNLKIDLFAAQYNPLFTLSLNFRTTRNAVAMGRTFNPTTGANLWTPQNVNGNWNVGADLSIVRQFGEQKRFSFTSSTQPSFNHSVDLAAIEGDTDAVRSIVKNTYLSQSLQLDYRHERWRIGGKGSAAYTYATSRREGFDDINAVNYTAGLTGHVDLPGGVGVDTDLTLYGRRGYDDNSLNTDDVVWNARISKSIMQGNLTFTVDAFDILGQLSNVRRAVNAQGWTETYYNVFPRYVMAHVIYKLNIEPKKNRK